MIDWGGAVQKELGKQLLSLKCNSLCPKRKEKKKESSFREEICTSTGNVESRSTV